MWLAAGSAGKRGQGDRGRGGRAGRSCSPHVAASEGRSTSQGWLQPWFARASSMPTPSSAGPTCSSGVCEQTKPLNSKRIRVPGGSLCPCRLSAGPIRSTVSPSAATTPSWTRCTKFTSQGVSGRIAIGFSVAGSVMEDVSENRECTVAHPLASHLCASPHWSILG